MSHKSAKDFNRAMGAVIRKHRLTMGLKQIDVGAALGVSYQQIQKFESGLNGLSAFQMTKLAAVFGVAVADLYAEASVTPYAATPTAAESDSYLAARYVGRIADPKLRSSIIDFTRQVAYQGATV